MRPRTFWLALALGTATIGLLALLRNGDPAVRERLVMLASFLTAWLVSSLAAMTWRPVYWVPVAAIAIGMVSVGWRIRVLRRRAVQTGATTEQPSFNAVLEDAVAAASDPRRRQATLMAERGQPIGAIARETRLARDAVRTVIRPA